MLIWPYSTVSILSQQASSTQIAFFLPLSEWYATIEHKDILGKKDLIHHLVRELVGRDIWNLLHVHFSRGFILNHSFYTAVCVNLYWLKIIPLFSSTYSYPLSVQLSHFNLFLFVSFCFRYVCLFSCIFFFFLWWGG